MKVSQRNKQASRIRYVFYINSVIVKAYIPKC